MCRLFWSIFQNFIFFDLMQFQNYFRLKVKQNEKNYVYFCFSDYEIIVNHNKNKMQKILLFWVSICLILSCCQGGLAKSTSHQGISYAKTNIFKDKSLQGTRYTIDKSRLEKEYLTATTASPIDRTDFSALQSYQLYFDGKSGLSATFDKLESTQVPQSKSPWLETYSLSEWTFGVWFMFETTPWEDLANSNKSTLLHFNIHQGSGDGQELSCTIDGSILQCFGEVAQKQMQIDLKSAGVRAQEWFYLQVDSKNRYHRMVIFDQSLAVRREVRKASSGPISMGNMDLSVGLPPARRDGGFVGYIKGFKFFKERLETAQQSSNIAFQYLHPVGSPSLLIELQLDDSENNGGVFEQVNQFNMVQIGDNVVGQRQDLSPPWDCFYQADSDYFDLFRFSGPNTQMEKIELPAQNYKDTSDKSGSYQLTLKMWIYREHLSQTLGEVFMKDGTIYGRPQNVNNASSYDEVLFQHDQIMTLKFRQESNDYLTIYHFNDPTKELKIKVPRGQWVWLVAEHSEDYFSAYIQDMNRRIMSKQTEVVFHKSNPNYRTNSKYVHIAPNFFGYIKGIKYFKNLQINKDAEYFMENSSSNSSLLFYYKFDQSNINKEKQFANLATGSGPGLKPASVNSSYIITVNPSNSDQMVVQDRQPQFIFDRMPFKDYSSKFVTGQYDRNVNWDGAVCSDAKLNVFLANHNSLLQLNINTKGSNLDQMHVSFWVRVKSEFGNLPNSTIFKITELEDGSSVHMDISIRNNTLVCNVYPQTGGAPQIVEYGSFKANDAWAHITCFFDSNPDSKYQIKNLLRGSLYQDGKVDHYYYNPKDDISKMQDQFFQPKSLAIKSQKLSIFMQGIDFTNFKQSYNPASDGVFFEDLRVYNKYLTEEDVYVSRHQKIANAESETGLLVYAKLLEGAKYPYKFFNWATQKSFKSFNVKAIAVKEGALQKPLICPSYYVYSYKTKLCVQDILAAPQTISGFVMKDNLADGFVVAPDIRYQEPEYAYFRSIAPQILELQWEVTSHQFETLWEAVNQQKNGAYLTLRDELFKDLPQNHQFSVSLDIQDKLGHGNMSPLRGQRIDLTLNPCARFYDLETGQALVDRDLRAQRGVLPFTFQFAVKDCDAFSFPTAAADFKIELLTVGQKAFKFDTFERNENQVQVPRSFMSFIPYNEVFYIIASAKFSNKANPGETQWLSIVYRSKWLTSFNLDFAQDQIGVAHGQDLSIDGSKVSVVNTPDSNQALEGLRWAWLCPPWLDCSGISQTDKKFAISNSQLAQVKVENMREYQFVLEIRADTSQPNSDSPYIQQKFNVTWLGPPAGVKVQYSPGPYSVSSDINFKLLNSDVIWFQNVLIDWAVQGTDYATRLSAVALNPATDFMNQNNQLAFNIKKDSFTAVGSYIIRLQLFSKQFNSTLVHTESHSIRIVQKPTNGTIFISKGFGDALTTTFTIQAPAWVAYDSSQELSYEFFYEDSETQQMASLGQPSKTPEIKTILPATKKLMVRVEDEIGGVGTNSIGVDIKMPVKGFEPSQLMYNIDQIGSTLENSTDTGEGLTELSKWTSSLGQLGRDMSADQIQEVSVQILSTLEKGLGKLASVTDTKEKMYITNSAILQVRQICQQPANSGHLQLVKEALNILKILQEDQGSAIQDLFEQDFQANVGNFLSLIASLENDLSGYSYALRKESTDNNTLSVQSMKLAQQMTRLDKNIGSSMKAGQRYSQKHGNLEFYQQKISKTNGLRDNVSFISADNNVKLIFPLSTVSQPTESQVLTSIIFTDNKTETYPPDFHTQGGPFSGRTYASQKVISENTVYLTYRDTKGRNLEQESTIDLSFRLSYSHYLYGVFQKEQQENLKCAYISSEVYDFDSFKTEKCQTDIINSKNQIVFTSRNTTTSEPHKKKIPFLEKVGYAFDYVTVRCQCQHMSYFLVIEDIPLVNLEEAKLNQYLNSVRNFRDWPMAFVVMYIIVTVLALILVSRGRDIEEAAQLKATEEMDLEKTEHVGGKSKADKEVFSLMTWVFNRKLAIDPYIMQNQQYTGSVSTWVLFKLYMSHLHPLLSLSRHQDISLSRADRSLVLSVKIFMCFIVCYFSLFDLEFEFSQIEWGHFLRSEKDAVAYRQRNIILIAFGMCSVILLPTPSSVFGPCRSRYRLVNRIISEGPQSSAYQQFLEQVLEQNGGKPAALSDRKDTVRAKKIEKKVYIDSLWPISTVMQLNSMPFEKIAQISAVFDRSYTSKKFRASMRIIQKESEQMAQAIEMMQPREPQEDKEGVIPRVVQPSSKGRVVSDGAGGGVGVKAEQNQSWRPLIKERSMMMDQLSASDLKANSGHTRPSPINMRPFHLNINDGGQSPARDGSHSRRLETDPPLSAGRNEQYSQRQLITQADNQLAVFNRNYKNAIEADPQLAALQKQSEDKDEVMFRSGSQKKVAGRKVFNINQRDQSVDAMEDEASRLDEQRPGHQQDELHEGGSPDSRNMDSPKVPSRHLQPSNVAKLQAKDPLDHRGTKLSLEYSNADITEPPTGAELIKVELDFDEQLSRKFKTGQFQSANSNNVPSNNYNQNQGGQQIEQLGVLQQRGNTQQAKRGGQLGGGAIHRHKTFVDNQNKAQKRESVGSQEVQLAEKELGDGEPVAYFVDELGNMVQLEEVDSQEIIDPDLIMEEEEDMPHLTFIDERKELVIESNCCGKFLGRFAQLLFVLLLLATWYGDYTKNRSYFKMSGFLWPAIFFFSQLASFFIIQPILIFFTAAGVASGFFKLLCCGSEQQLSRAMPLALMLYADLKDQTELVRQFKG